MRLSEVKEEIKTGDVLLYRGTKPHSRLIRFWTQSVYSHVGMAVWMGGGTSLRLCAIEALEPGGVRVVPIEHSIGSTWTDWFELDHAMVDGYAAADYALSKWMDAYSSPRQFVRSYSLVWSQVAMYLGLPADVGVNQFHCSELVTGGLVAGGLKSALCPPPARSTPGDVSLYVCLKRKGKVEV